MHETAYAKINLALHVRARRQDGYHELETALPSSMPATNWR
jgi:4-diphosphocytidyl-2-C-methyl-D-erythritol kinase